MFFRMIHLYINIYIYIKGFPTTTHGQSLVQMDFLGMYIIIEHNSSLFFAVLVIPGFAKKGQVFFLWAIYEINP